jgi:hypothetical protein
MRAAVCYSLRAVPAAVKFPRATETAWMLASTLGFLLDVFVYHTFSLFLKSVMKLRKLVVWVTLLLWVRVLTRERVLGWVVRGATCTYTYSAWMCGCVDVCQWICLHRYEPHLTILSARIPLNAHASQHCVVQSSRVTFAVTHSRDYRLGCAARRVVLA